MYVVEVYSCDVLTVCDRGTEDQLAAPVTCPLPFPLYFVFIVIPHHHHPHHYHFWFCHGGNMPASHYHHHHHPSFIIIKIHQLGPNNQVIASLPDYNFQTPRFDGFHIDEQANGKSSVHNSPDRAFSVNSKFFAFPIFKWSCFHKMQNNLIGEWAVFGENTIWLRNDTFQAKFIMTWGRGV